MHDRLPPQNLEAEQSVIGSILIDKQAIHEISDTLNAEMFYREAHSIIYESMLSLAKQNEPIDIVTVTNDLRKKDQLDMIGGGYYLTQVIGGVPTSANIKHYAGIILEQYLLRQIIKVSSEVNNQCYECESSKDVLSLFQSKVNDISNINAKGDFTPIKDLISGMMDKIEERCETKVRPGIPTGYSDLDKKFALRNGELVVIAARPAMGKTAFALNICVNVAKLNHKVGVFSLEMANEQLLERISSSESNVDNNILKGTEISEHDFERISKAIGTIYGLGIELDDSPGQNVQEMKSKAIRLKKKKGLDLLVIDYLGFIAGNKKDKKSRFDLVSENVREIKNLARELNIPVILLAQLSRAVESRDSKEPRLSDLRESGEIEQTADAVVFIHREAYYEDSADNTAKIIIAKHRNGPTGAISLTFIPEITKFVNLERSKEFGTYSYDN